MKKYNNLSELLHELSASRKYDTSLDAAIMYQDLIGHETMQSLGDLANGDHREMFYTVYQIAYGTIDTLKFYAQHSNYCINLRYEKDEAAAQLEIQKSINEAENKDHSRRYNEVCGEVQKATKEIVNLTREADTLKAENERMTAEITALKAKLYDLITK